MDFDDDHLLENSFSTDGRFSDLLEQAFAMELSENTRLSPVLASDGEPKPESLIPKKLLNGTAYRIFKLLQWLIEAPLTLDGLNARFLGDARIGKAVSNDSVWLYINTLKALGCKIRRPSPKNGFCYELQSHPFGLSLPEGRQDALILAKAYAQKSFSHQEMMVLDGVFKKIIRHSNVPSPQACIDNLFRDSRSFDLENCADHIRLLEKGISQEELFQVKYRSPAQGDEDFLFLPELLYYEQGVPYVRGDRPDVHTPSSLRVDRIFKVRSVQNAALLQDLLARRGNLSQVKLRLFMNEPALWSGLGLDVRHGVYSETIVQTHSTGRAYVELEFQVRDFFYLKQRLLASGCHFQIHAPTPLRDDIQRTLDKMLAFYLPSSAPFGNESRKRSPAEGSEMPPPLHPVSPELPMRTL